MFRSGFVRFAVSLLLYLGFLAITWGIGGVLLYIGWQGYVRWHFEDNFAQGVYWMLTTGLAGIGAFLILAPVIHVIAARRKPFGPAVTAEEQPRLFETAGRIAALVGRPRPTKIYLQDDYVFGAVLDRGPLWFRTRPAIFLGLPVFYLLNTAEMEAVLAQILMYSQSIDHHTARLLTMTHHAIESFKWLITKNLPPYSWYERFFHRTWERIVDTQCRIYDMKVAGLMGSGVWARVLRVNHQNETSFYLYLRDEVLPAARRGYHAPWMEGFAQYREAYAGKTHRSLKDEKTEPNISKTAKRAAAIAHLPVGPEGDATPAVSLLDNVMDIEKKIFLREAPDGSEELRSIPWTQAGHCSVLPTWNALCRSYNFKLDGVTLGSLWDVIADIDSFACYTNWDPDTGTPQSWARHYSKHVLIAALGRTLAAQGWYIDHSPGYIRMRSLHHEIDPAQLIDDLSDAAFTKEKWLQTLEEWELDPGAAMNVEPLEDDRQAIRRMF